MPKDISQYMEFGKGDDRYPKRSIKSLINLPAIVLGWNVFESRFKDGNPSGKFVQLTVELDAGKFLVNTGSGIIMEQLEAIKAAKEKAGESDMGFTCIVKRFGKGIKMFPVDWSRKDVCKKMGKEREQDGCADQGL